MKALNFDTIVELVSRGTLALLVSLGVISQCSAKDIKSKGAILNLDEHSEICASIQDRINNLSISTSVYDWPKKLSYPGLTWPQWIDVNPSKNREEVLSLIEKDTEWSGSRQFYISDRKWLESTGGTQALEEGWKKYWLPLVEAALKTNTLSLQRANIDFNNNFINHDSGKRTFVLRFRVKPAKNINFEYEKTHMGPGGLYDNGNWVYLVQNSEINASLKNTPVNSYSMNVHGEMGYIYGNPVIFETGNGYLAWLYVLSINNSGDEFSSIGIGAACQFKMPTLRELRKIPSPSTLQP